MAEMEYKIAPTEFIAVGDKGEYEGHFSVFGNVDDGRDIVHPGAFLKTIAERGRRVKVFFAHDWSKLIGPPPSTLSEDSTGLFAAGRLTLESFWGREAFALMKDNALTEGSIGYETVKADYGDDGVRNLRELKLYEISPVPLGMNALTEVRAVKQLMAGGMSGAQTQMRLYSEAVAFLSDELKTGRLLRGENSAGVLSALRAVQGAYEVKFSGSPRNPFGTHSSYQFRGGQAGYKAAWHCHFFKIRDTGPIQGTVRRCEMIAATLKPSCSLPTTEHIDASRKPPDDCSFPEKPSDYDLAHWKEPESDEDREGMKLSCSDLAIIKRAALGEIKRRAEEREEEEGGKCGGGSCIPPVGEINDDPLAEDIYKAMSTPWSDIADFVLHTKEGRVLSASSMEKVRAAIDSMQAALDTLERLLEAAKPPKAVDMAALMRRLRMAEQTLVMGTH